MMDNLGFSCTLSSKYGDYREAYEYLDQIQDLSTKHDKYKISFLNTLIQLRKFDEAFNFSKKIWSKEELFFEVELIMGLNFFLEENYTKAEMHFLRLDKISRYDIFSTGIFGNILNAWVKASEKNRKDSFEYINKIPLQRFGTPEDISNLTLFLSSDFAEYITGQIIGVDGSAII